MSKVCIFSDIHVFPWPAYHQIDEQGVSTRLKDTINVLKQIIEIAKTENCSVIVFSGDLFHVPRIDTMTLDLTARALSDSVTPIVMIPGNHDEATKFGEFHSIRAFNRRQSGIYVLDGREGDSVKINGLKIGGIPFQGTNDALLKWIKKFKGFDIVLMHTGFVGAEAGFEYVADQKNYISVADLKLKKRGIRWGLAGHFHDPQIFYRKDEKPTRVYGDCTMALPEHTVLIPGAPLHHTFGDCVSDRGCWILDTDKEMAKFIRLRFPRFVQLNRFHDAVSEKGAEKIIKGNFISYKAKTREDYNTAVELFEALGARGYTVTLERSKSSIARKADGIDLETKQEDVLKEFIKRQKNKPASLKTLLKTGIRLLRKAEIDV